MRALGLDIGERRIGLAVGDTAGGIATPIGALRRTSVARDAQAVVEEARRQKAEVIVAGVPYQPDGSAGPWGRAVTAFCETLRAASGIRVEPWDERLSTAEAERALRSVGKQPSRDRARLDAASAAVILQSYLDTHHEGRGAGSDEGHSGPRSGLLRLGILGYPLRHTISPVFQQAALDHCGIAARYEAWATPPERLALRVRELASEGVLGFNVTVPHKEAILPLLDELDDRGRDLGAVNTVVNRDGRLVGSNTDAAGFLKALREDADFDPRGVSVLMLGAGGAARAAALTLSREGVASMVVANRTLDRARALADLLHGSIKEVAAVSLTPEALRGVLDSASPGLIVNTTTVGMAHGPAEGESPLAAELIPPTALVYDLVYTPAMTPLLQAARRAGARTLGGLPMLVYQGAAAFTLWTGREAPVTVMFTAARRALALEA